MAGLFDDLIPAQPGPAPSGAPPAASGAPASPGMFDDLIPPLAAAAGAGAGMPAGPQSAGDALDMVEGTGTAAYDTGPAAMTAGQKIAAAPGAVAAALDGAANAVPFTDRMAAAAAAATGLGGKFGDYSGNLAQLRSEEGATMAAHPDAAMVGELAGGAALPVPAVGWIGKGAATAAKIAAEAKAAQTGITVAADTTPLWVKAARGATVGAGLGAAQGASSSSDLTDAGQTATDAGVGAGVGAFVGASVPSIAHGVGAGYRWATPDTVAPVPGVSNTARDVFLSGIDKDGAANVQRNAALYGDAAMPFDYGTGLRGIAEGLATKDGQAASTIGDALGYRQAATNSRVRTGLMQNFGAAEDPTAVKATIGDVQNAATAPLFARADAAGMPWSPDADALMQRPAVATAMRGAAQDAANAGTPLPTVVLDEVGQPVGSNTAVQAYEAGQRPAVTSALADMLGADPALGPLATQDALAAQRKAASDPLYAAYRQMSVPMTSDLAEVLNTPSGRSAIGLAERKAQDQGRSIFAPRPNRFESDPLGSGATPEPPIDLDNIPPFQAEQAPSRPGPVGVLRPVDLQGFIRSAGGIQDRGGDLAAMGYQNLVARPGQGLGADAMRQAAAQSGYLGADIDHATANTTVNDLFGAIGSDNPIHSVFDQDAAAAWAARDAAMQDFQRGGAARGEVGRDAGFRPMAPGMPFGGPDAPTGPAARAPQITPEGLDYIKRTLQEKADTARRGGSNDDARIFGDLKDKLLTAIENHPDPSIAEAYGAARRAYAGPSREMDALTAGRAAFGDNVTPEQVQREYGALATDGERQQYRNGLFAAGRDKMAKAGDTRNFVDMVAGNDAIRSKFGAVAPHQTAVDTFNAAMDRARAQFTEAQRPTPQAWRATLDRLDAQAAKGDAGAAAARDALATHLGQNPDFARGREIQQTYGGLRDAVDYGRGSLAGGGDPVWPSGFAERFAAMTPAEQAAVRTGQRSLMEEAVGTKPNDQLAIKGLFQTGNTPGYTAPGVEPGAPDLSGWNAQKLAAAYGEAPVGRMQELLNANDAMHDTFQGVMQNSKTARRLSMKEALADAEWKPKDVMSEGHGDDTVLGLIRSITAKGLNAVAHSFQNAPSNAIRDTDLARIGTMTGAERDAMMDQLMDRLPAYRGRESAADAVRERALMLATALAGGGGVAAMDPMERQRLIAERLSRGARQ